MIATWIPLTEIAQIDAILEASKSKTQIIFKDSTTCGISAQAKDELVSNWAFTDGEFDFHYLDLLNFREVSAAVAEKTGERHQSPQLLVIKDRKVVYAPTHFSIKYEDLKSKLES